MSDTKPRKARAKNATPTAPKLPGVLTGGELNGFPLMRVKAAALHGADYNPRDINESALDGLKTSVSEFGMPQPIIWNQRTDRLVGGHQRLKTLAPDAETDVVVVDLDEIREKALNLALNNPHTMGHWTEKLGELIADVERGLGEELFGSLSLDELHLEVPVVDDLVPPEGFPVIDDGDLRTDHRCPKCGYEF